MYVCVCMSGCGENILFMDFANLNIYEHYELLCQCNGSICYCKFGLKI